MVLILKKLKYIYIDEGEYLYDSVTNKAYSYTAPHKLVGVINKDYVLIKNDSIKV
jgi:hypothetical protein